MPPPRFWTPKVFLSNQPRRHRHNRLGRSRFHNDVIRNRYGISRGRIGRHRQVGKSKGNGTGAGDRECRDQEGSESHNGFSGTRIAVGAPGQPGMRTGAFAIREVDRSFTSCLTKRSGAAMTMRRQMTAYGRCRRLCGVTNRGNWAHSTLTRLTASPQKSLALRVPPC